MQKFLRYTIFKTKWGYFGLAGNKCGLVRICLPIQNRKKVKEQLLKDAATARYDRGFSKPLQKKTIAYFNGLHVGFDNDIPVVLDGLSDFTRKVLTACRDIRFGETISYSDLAKRSGRPNAARAVGRILAKNPLPLIIPCHRIIRNNGKIGGFSAQGGIKLKKKMLKIEH